MAKTVLAVHNLEKSFNETSVLHNISFTIQEGEVVVIIGPSGCGKSTLLRCINGLEGIGSGSITLNAVPVQHQSKDMHLIRQKIGMVFQSYDLFPHMDVMSNLLLGPRKVLRRSMEEATAEAKTFLERVGLKGKEYVLPRQLSGGQKQRVALVRAMMMHPEILLLDEITAALDPEMVREVLNVVLDLARDGMTMAIVTHEMRFAEAVADRVLFMENGLIVEEGTSPAFFHEPQTERARRFLDIFEYENKMLDKK